MLTSENLVLERPHLDGIQRVYKFDNGGGVSMVNAPMLHLYSFAWEAAVVTGCTDDGSFSALTYDTPLTGDVEVFQSDAEANEFLTRAREYFATAAAA